MPALRFLRRLMNMLENNTGRRFRIAFDLDETLGVPLINGATMVGFQLRPGCVELLTELRDQCVLALWSVSSRRYLDKALSYGLGQSFSETYSWDELPTRWKDVRRIDADLLVDDSPQHLETARAFGLESAYVVVPQYGSPEDAADPLCWVRLVELAIEARIRSFRRGVLSGAGIFQPDDPLVQEWKQIMAENRRRDDESPDRV